MYQYPDHHIYLQYQNLIDEITVPEGFKTIIERFEGPSELLELTENEQDTWNDIKSDFVESVRQAVSRAGESMTKAVEAVEEALDQIHEALTDMDDVKTNIEERLEEHPCDESGY